MKPSPRAKPAGDGMPCFAGRLMLPCCFAILQLLSPCSHAESPNPGGPSICPAGTNCSYVVDSAPAGKAASGMPSLRTSSKPGEIVQPTEIVRWEISRWGDITHVMTSDRAGQRGEIWVKGGLKIVRPPEGTGYYPDTDPPEQDRFVVDLGPYGYPHTAWIVPEAYERQVKNKDSKALYFRLNPGKLPSPEKEAWIDAKTRQPLCVKENGVSYTFRMLEPDPLELPPEVLGVIDAQTRAMQPFAAEIRQHAHGQVTNNIK